MNNQELMKRLDEIIGRSETPKEFEGLKNYLGKCFSPDTPSHQIDIMELSVEFYRRYRYIRSEDKSVYDSLADQATAFLEAMGYRTNIFTSQEHALVHSSRQDPKSPYKPLGLLDGKYTLEETRKARELQRIGGASTVYIKIPGLSKDVLMVNATLEPLDEDGNTIRDPQPLDENLNPIKNYKKTGKFPYRRD